MFPMMLRLQITFLLMLGLGWGMRAWTQPLKQIELDSLEVIIRENPTQNLEAIMRLAEGYRVKDPVRSEHFAQMGRKLALQADNLKIQIQAYDLLGKISFAKGQYQSAGTYFKRGLDKAEESGQGFPISILSNSMGILKRTIGEYEEALLHFQRSLQLYQQFSQIPPQISVMINIGGLHLLLEQYDKAIEVLNEAILLAQEKKVGKNRSRGILAAHLGAAHKGKGELSMALAYYEESLQLNEKTGNPVYIVEGLTNVFALLSIMDAHRVAGPYYDRANTIVDSLNLIPQKINLLQEKGTALRLQGKLAMAQQVWEEALALAKLQEQQNQEVILELQKLLSEITAAQTDFQVAYQYLEEYQSSQQNRYSQDLANNIADLEQRFELQQKLIQADEELRVAQRERDNQRNRFLWTLVAIFLTLIALIALYSRFQIKKRAHITLSQQNDAIQQQNQLLAVKNEEIQTQNDLLADQSEAIRRQNQLLQQSNADLEQFAYAASHDLREPLRTIRSYLQLLERRFTDSIDETGREFIQFATDGASRMDTLLKDLLAYSRIGRSGMQVDWVDMKGLVANVLDSLHRQISDTHAVIRVSELPKIKGFESELHLLFQNLVSNALKFHKEGVIPEIRIKAQSYADYYIFSVSDNGIGIPDEFKDSIFNIFQRLHARNSFEGTGIGLAICKKVASEHQGEIWLESKENQGATFFIKLPRY